MAGDALITFSLLFAIGQVKGIIINNKKEPTC